MNLTALGLFHTLVSIVPLFLGLSMLVRRGRITSQGVAGQVYAWVLVISCITAFGTFRHGGAGLGHVLSILTLLLLAAGALAERRRGGQARLVASTVCLTFTYFFVLLFTVTESFTRLPPAAPIAANLQSRTIRAAQAILLVGTVAGLVWQVRRIRRDAARASSSLTDARTA